MKVDAARARGWGATGPVAAAALCVIAAARVVPFEAIPLWRCVWRTLTGVPCPGCGMTTAFTRLVRGDVAGGIEASPLGALLFAGCVGLALLGLLRALGWSVRLDTTLGERRLAGVGLVVLGAANWAYLLFARGIL